MVKMMMYCDKIHADLIECPQFVADKRYKYLTEFELWEKRKEPPLSYTPDDFINWLNEKILINSSEKIRYIKKQFIPEESEKEKYLALYIYQKDEGRHNMVKIMMYCDSIDVDLIECPQFVADKRYKYLDQFGLWKKRKDGPPLCYTPDDFINWLNEKILINDNEKIRYIKKQFIPEESEKERYSPLYI